MATLNHYIIVVFRNLARHKTFAFVNTIGLAFGMLVCLALIMLISNHLMFDRYNTKYDRIYRICRTDGTHANYRATVPLPIRNELLERYTGVENAVRFNRGFGNQMGNPLLERPSIPVAGLFADPGALDLFEYQLEYGDPNTALVEPYSVVLSKNAAKKLFNQENPVGETLSVGEIGKYKVTGVLKEMNNQTHIEFEALASMATLRILEAEKKSLDPSGVARNDELENWQAGNGWVYVLLEAGKSPTDVQLYLDSISARHYAAAAPELKWTFSLQKLSEITPGIPRGNEIGPIIPWIFIYFLAAIALSILATSCFNFTTLSIARSLNRAKEIGVRKVSGASRGQIFVQFTLESVIISILSLGLAITTMLLIRPYFLGLSLARFGHINLTANFYIYLIFLLFAIIVGITAGLFPAAILSGFKPVNVLQNLNNLKVLSKIGLRRGLIITQFSIALVFITTTIVVYKQFVLFVHVDHGFEMNNNIVVELNKTSSETLKTELARYGNVESISAASHVPAGFIRYWSKFKKLSGQAEWNELVYFAVDEDYIRNINVALVAGRFFSSESTSSKKHFVVINEEAVKSFHYESPHAAIGEVLIDERDSSELEIIGIVKNYNSTQVTGGIQPTVLIYLPEQFNILQVKYSGPYTEATKSIESAWAKVNPGTKAGYSKLKDEVLKFYSLVFGDLTKILGAIAFFSITICCLGLLGIVFYSMETRTKEISIRKLYGASDSYLVILLSRSFIGLFLISILIGGPISYLINIFWLENLANHIVLGAEIIISGIVILGSLAALTICSQTFRATNVKPIDTLKVD
jgi:putative ABC transport system permease protein